MKNTKIQLSKNIFDAIKEKKVEPRAKWQCLLFSRIAWAISFVLVVIGSLAFSVVLYMVINNDWDLYTHLGDSLIEFIFVTLPYFWILILAVLVLLALFSSKFTEDAYRYKLATLIFASLIVNVILGGTFYVFGMGEFIDLQLQKEIPLYNSLSYDKDKMWTQPEKGILAGTIISQNGDELVVEDYLSNTWTIVISANSNIKGRVMLKTGEKIKIIGSLGKGNVFLANEIRPWTNQGLGGGRGMHGYTTP
ncbi:hypothetical protein C0583_00495 [Candidatus Parcubacteria bacterium]|nr:MAG: hypothetical protein C0583_00495 [Candidatus Parcubacteria bacterium]